MSFYLEGGGDPDLKSRYNVRIERYQFKYAGAQIICAFRLGLAAAVLAAIGGFFWLGLTPHYALYLILMIPFTTLAVYLLGRILFWFASLGGRGEIDLNLPQDLFGFPRCKVGGIDYVEGRFSQIESVSRGKDPGKKRLLYPLYLKGSFGNWTLRFPKHAERDFAHKAFTFSQRLLEAKKEGHKASG